MPGWCAHCSNYPERSPQQYKRSNGQNCTLPRSTGVSYSTAWPQVPGRPKYDASVGVRTRRQAAAHGSGVIRAPTPLPARLMHAVVQLLQQAAAPPDDTADWRELLYGEYSDSGDEGDGGGGGTAAASERPSAGDHVRRRRRPPCCAVLCCPR